jgi:hypothetical protein
MNASRLSFRHMLLALAVIAVWGTLVIRNSSVLVCFIARSFLSAQAGSELA